MHCMVYFTYIAAQVSKTSASLTWQILARGKGVTCGFGHPCQRVHLRFFFFWNVSHKISVVCKRALYDHHVVNNLRQKHKSLENSLHWPKSPDRLKTGSVSFGLWTDDGVLQFVTMRSTEINCHLYLSSNNSLKLKMHRIRVVWEAYTFSEPFSVFYKKTSILA